MDSFRRSCSTTMPRCRGATPAHKVRNQIDAAHRRSDLFERRRARMKDWDAYVVGTHSARPPEQPQSKSGQDIWDAVQIDLRRLWMCHTHTNLRSHNAYDVRSYSRGV